MNKKEHILQLVITQKLVPLYYHDSGLVSMDVLKALYSAGIKTVEYTNRGENALDNFIYLRKKINENMPGLYLGIGTIKTVSDAEIFIAAGADFIVSPIVNTEMATVVHKAKLLWIPGCMTPTEIHLAEANNATLVKIFPGNLLQPSFISAIKELFPDLLFMVTGGVEKTEQNIQAWFDAGAAALGMGSKLISKPILQKGNYSQITSDAESILQIIQNIKAK